MSDSIQYAYRIDSGRETPCHLSAIKKGDVFYLVTDANKSELLKATDDAFSTVANATTIWSIPYETCK